VILPQNSRYTLPVSSVHGPWTRVVCIPSFSYVFHLFQEWPTVCRSRINFCATCRFHWTSP